MSGRRHPSRGDQPRLRASRGNLKVSGKRSCPTGKVRFGTEYDAEKATGRLRDEALAEGRRAPCRIYQCSQCGGGWHMTSQQLHE